MRTDHRGASRFAICALAARGDDSALVLARSLGETVALRAGPPGGEDEALLLRALSLGAMRAVRLWDPVLEKTDYSGLATALAAAIRHLCCPLVLVTDRGHGALGPTVADRLDVPHLCGVVEVRLVDREARSAAAIDREARSAEVQEGPEGPGGAGYGGAEQQLLIKRRIRRGVQELRGGAAAVLCVLPQAAAAEPADGPRGEVEAMNLEQLGIRAQELTQRRGMLTPGATGTAAAPRPVVLDSARELLLRLQRDGLLRR